MDYADYQHLTFDLKPNGVLRITINRPEVLNATNARLHWELTQVWGTVDADPRARVALVTGAGKAFSAGGDLELVEEIATNPEAAVAHHARGQRSRLQHDQPRQAGRLRHQRGGGGGRSGRGSPGRRQHHRGNGPPHRRSHAPRRGGRRSRGHHLAAPVRDGQGQVLPAHLRLHRRPRGRAHRAGEPVRAAGPAHGTRAAMWPIAWPAAPSTPSATPSAR